MTEDDCVYGMCSKTKSGSWMDLELQTKAANPVIPQAWIDQLTLFLTNFGSGILYTASGVLATTATKHIDDPKLKVIPQVIGIGAIGYGMWRIYDAVEHPASYAEEGDLFYVSGLAPVSTSSTQLRCQYEIDNRNSGRKICFMGCTIGKPWVDGNASSGMQYSYDMPPQKGVVEANALRDSYFTFDKTKKYGSNPNVTIGGSYFIKYVLWNRTPSLGCETQPTPCVPIAYTDWIPFTMV